MKIKYITNTKEFERIPGVPIAYWLTDNEKAAFEVGAPLSDFADCCTGMQTGNNGKYVRLWHEVCFDATQIGNSEGKWYRYNCGGESRKWYGNYLNIVNWKDDGKEIRNEKSSVIRNERFFLSEGITWKRISSGTFAFRYLPPEFIFDQAGDSMFIHDGSKLLYIMSLVNSRVAYKLSECISPTVNLTAGNMVKIPVIEDSNHLERVSKIASDCVSICKEDWDSFEYTWDFSRHPLLGGVNMGTLISDKYKEWEQSCEHRFDTLKKNEEELNRLFISLYGLENETTPEVQDKDVSIRLANKEREIKSLISYLVGVVMGRFSLDSDGIVYAGGVWEKSAYKTYIPDEDGVVPLYNFIGINDGLLKMICDLLKQIYGDDTFEENLSFIAESLGKKRDESNEDALNRYLNDKFYDDHLQVYQKRPIYWMLSSGKQGAFKCLIYLHRYNKNTLATVNAKYFLPRTAMYKAERERLETRLASGQLDAREKKNVEAELKNIEKCEEELLEYGQVLDYLANQYIELDLDDGVKENYLKFQRIPLEVNGARVKKDLLVPFGLEKDKK